MTAFLSMSPQDRLSMGSRGREKAEQEFSQENVVDAYLDALRITPNLTPAAGLPG
jgi:hypothetical protein